MGCTALFTWAMIYMMKESNMIINAEQAVRRLASEHPDWLPVLEAAVSIAKDVEPDGDFAGAWVANKLGHWIPNLRILVSYGLLEKSGPSTRGGRRAYYRMPNREGIERALESWHEGRRPAGRTLRFIAAGQSSDLPADAARRAGEVAYEPRSWR